NSSKPVSGHRAHRMKRNHSNNDRPLSNLSAAVWPKCESRRSKRNFLREPRVTEDALRSLTLSEAQTFFQPLPLQSRPAIAYSGVGSISSASSSASARDFS